MSEESPRWGSATPLRVEGVFPTPGCAICGNHLEVQLHHLIPKSRGGADDAQNMAWLCVLCHRTIHRVYMLLIRGRTIYSPPDPSQDSSSGDNILLKVIASFYPNVRGAPVPRSTLLKRVGGNSTWVWIGFEEALAQLEDDGFIRVKGRKQRGSVVLTESGRKFVAEFMENGGVP